MAPRKQQEAKTILEASQNLLQPHLLSPARLSPRPPSRGRPSPARTLLSWSLELGKWSFKLKEVDGRRPDMNQEIFGRKIVLEQGFSKVEDLSIHAFIAGKFYITFVSIGICKWYWEMVKTSGPHLHSPFSVNLLGTVLCKEKK